MKPLLLGFLPAAFLFLVAGLLHGQANPALATPHFELYQPNQFSKPPIGVLGLSLGTFAVIKGTEHHTSKFWGSDDFVVESINGKKVDRDLRIMTDWAPQLPDKRISGNQYVLHGYERGEWGGQPDGLPKDEPSGWTQSGGFSFQHIFAVTSVEKVNGVTVADARPLDHHVPLAQPNLAARTDDARPIGVLGLTLGTFAVIEVHSSKRLMMVANPLEIKTVNGKRLQFPRLLSIPGFVLPRNTEQATLRGFETGSWEGAVWLPDSEYPSNVTASRAQGQALFVFSTHFVVTSVAKTATPAQAKSAP
jgi:hypothetical protein